MRRELDYIRIEDALGGNQEWLPERDMNRGGCGAVTACDLCIYLARQRGLRSLYPYDADRLTKEDFIGFASIMKPYLSPRSTGIDRLDIYLDGLSGYWRDAGNASLGAAGFPGTAPFEEAEALARAQIDGGMPIPYLLLRHQNKAFEDFEWHWFNLTGYEEREDGLLVDAVTYGEPHWLNFRELWDTGEERRGGMIRVFEHHP